MCTHLFGMPAVLVQLQNVHTHTVAAITIIREIIIQLGVKIFGHHHLITMLCSHAHTQHIARTYIANKCARLRLFNEHKHIFQNIFIINELAGDRKICVFLCVCCTCRYRHL